MSSRASKSASGFGASASSAAPTWPTPSSRASILMPLKKWTPSRAERPRRFALTLLVVCATFARYPSALASDQVEPQILHLSKGDPAPYSGDLYPVDVSIRFALEVEGCMDRALLDLDHERAINAIALGKTQALAAAAADASANQIELLHGRLAEVSAWYRSPPVVAAVAAVITVAVLLTSTILVQATGEVVR